MKLKRASHLKSRIWLVSLRLPSFSQYYQDMSEVNLLLLVFYLRCQFSSHKRRAVSLLHDIWSFETGERLRFEFELYCPEDFDLRFGLKYVLYESCSAGSPDVLQYQQNCTFIFFFLSFSLLENKRLTTHHINIRQRLRPSGLILTCRSLVKTLLKI